MCCHRWIDILVFEVENVELRPQRSMMIVGVAGLGHNRSVVDMPELH